ncbi:hypothetical protein MAR_033640 [Mya arenaria]|uniref:Uncharacterized protein n=1 Tax=Mya arenaria TaxID=6604 RepID=A0ABY7G9J6_MYAAR|nr:hypothetical protein MAR_033640 [Mya arenaria]
MDKEVVDKALLQRLEEYGDSVVEGASIDKVKKKTDKQAKRNKSQGSSDTHNANTFVDTSSNNSRKKKKRRKKNKEKVEERVEDRDNEEVGFGSDPSDQENTKRERPSREKIPRNEENPEFDLEMARFEVHKYGIAGFRGNEKEVAMTALLIKLGAKDRKMGLKVAKKDGGEKRKRDRNDIGPLDGQVGRWKAGVQIVHKDNIKGMKKLIPVTMSVAFVTVTMAFVTVSMAFVTVSMAVAVSVSVIFCSRRWFLIRLLGILK